MNLNESTIFDCLINSFRLRRVEQNDARFAVEPLIAAERQRRYFEVEDKCIITCSAQNFIQI